MIINESAGSGGDALPYYFKQRKVGPLVGTRTWGGLVGTLGSPADDRRRRHHGAVAGVLRRRTAEWAVENEGVAPDIEVEIHAGRRGRGARSAARARRAGGAEAARADTRAEARAAPGARSIASRRSSDSHVRRPR